MKTLGILISILGVLVIIGGSLYSFNLMSEQSGRTYTCDKVEETRKAADKVYQEYQAAKGTPQEEMLAKKYKQANDKALLFLTHCEDDRQFYQQWITIGFLIAGAGLVPLFLGLGIFFIGRKRDKGSSLSLS